MGEVRMIGGRFKGRKLDVPQGARPTGDRTREMLFNWLMFDVEGARCLDLFAGSGALGMEALSRGASFVDFVDTNRKAVQSLTQTFTKWGIENAKAHCIDANQYLDGTEYDIVFIDAPFDLDVSPFVEKVCAKLLYVEIAKNSTLPLERFEVVKQKSLGNVTASLLRPL